MREQVGAGNRERAILSGIGATLYFYFFAPSQPNPDIYPDLKQLS